MATSLAQHNIEIAENLTHWERKPLLRQIYRSFHQRIAKHIRHDLPGITVELGSGIGNIKEVLPECLRTDIFPNPWLDRVENAYALSFSRESVANIILFDVFHHLEFPGNAFSELERVLVQSGRVIIFDPCVSILGRLVYGAFHHEPLGLREELTWTAPSGWSPFAERYYAAQGNTWRIFFRGEYRDRLGAWRIIVKERFAELSYVASGGYSKPQLYPDWTYPMMRRVDRVLDLMPFMFATRALVVLEKR